MSEENLNEGEEKKVSPDMTRRQFIAGVGAALVAGGVAGGAAGAIVSSRGGRAASPESEWDADVIVVGAGGAGLVAAIAAADAGAKVLQFEKQPMMGGCWLVSGGSSSGANTRIQFENGIFDDSPSLFYQDCMRMGQFHSDPEILAFHVQNAGLAIDWLDKLGAYQDRTPQPDIYYPPFSVMRTYSAADGGKGFYQVVQAEHQKRVDQGIVEVRMETQVTELLQAEGKVGGVKTIGADGEEKEYKAGAVILCTGGYTHNLELVRKYNYPQAVSIAPPHCTGDGYVMVEKVDGDFKDMEYLPPYLGGVPNPDKPGRQLVAVNMNKYPGAIWVDLNGQRVVNEDVGAYTADAKHALAEAPEATLIAILDKKIMDENDPIIQPSWGNEGWSWEEFDQKAQEGVHVQKANTIGELANLLGVDAQALENTIAAYNGYVEAGKDSDFGREELSYKIENPPFYAVKTIPTLLLSKGGPVINDQMQVLNKNGRVIPGLYVAGELAGGAKVSGYGNVTGVANTICVTFGKQAGKMAAHEALYRRF